MMKFLWLIIVIVVVFIVTNIFLVMSNLELNQALDEMNSTKETHFKAELEQARSLVQREMKEKHASEAVSYQAIAQRLEIEKQKVRQLQGIVDR